MSVRLWRFYNPAFASDPFDGEGARLVGGRWNFEGVPVIYCAGSLALAVLEVLVNAQLNLALSSYQAIPVDVDEKQIEKLDEQGLPSGWRQSPPAYSVRRIGTEWATRCSSLVLEVPSAVIPVEKNYVINPLHPAFVKLVKGKPISIPIDDRLLNWDKRPVARQ